MRIHPLTREAQTLRGNIPISRRLGLRLLESLRIRFRGKHSMEFMVDFVLSKLCLLRTKFSTGRRGKTA
jgi:hypothetical protein